MGRTTETGQLLREWRDAAGMKLDRAAVYVSDRTGVEISSEKLRRYETGWPESKMDPAVLLGLLGLYGKNLGELPVVSRERAHRLQQLASATIDSPPSGVVSFRMPVLAGV
jgi:hypothetical protein